MEQTAEQLLRKICVSENDARAEALKGELHAMNVSCECMDNKAIVIPAKTDDAVVLCAHFDVVPGSFGYNDNGMSLITILSMLKRLPENVEVVFTNGEECGFLGAQHYLKCSRKNILGCINLDVCGVGNMVYCDPMNSEIVPSGCKVGRMPLNDGVVFEEHGIPVLTFSTSRAEVPFYEGIHFIASTIHCGPLDNRSDILNFALPELVSEKVAMVIGDFSKRAY